MSKSIIFIHGSPRKKGNTHLLTSVAMQGAQRNGAEVAEIDSTQLSHKIPGCSSCTKCHQSEKFGCVINDQLAQAVASLMEYDVIVAATPTYWMSYPAQLKMFVDRMGSLMKYTETGDILTPLAGKEMAMLATGNGVLENNIDLLKQQWENIAGMMSCQFSSCLFPHTSIQPNLLKDDLVAQKKAEDFGKQLALPYQD